MIIYFSYRQIYECIDDVFSRKATRIYRLTQEKPAKIQITHQILAMTHRRRRKTIFYKYIKNQNCVDVCTFLMQMLILRCSRWFALFIHISNSNYSCRPHRIVHAIKIYFYIDFLMAVRHFL